jgi:hypothetical protein
VAEHIESCQGNHHLCPAGVRFYLRAVRQGRVPDVDVPGCLLRQHLVRPAVDDSRSVIAVRPSTALPISLAPLEREIHERQHRVRELRSAFESIEALYTAHRAPDTALTVLEGPAAIDAAMDRAGAECEAELRTVQPGGGRPPGLPDTRPGRGAALLARGVRLRTLFQHTARYSPPVLAYVERMAAAGDAQARTLAELFDWLVVVDRRVAFIPARDDHSALLELRHPALVGYLTGVFERAWRQAVPLAPGAGRADDATVIPEVQRAIMHLLVAGHLDDAIARRLGMSVRSCRGHIAKIAERVGSASRAQLGYLLATSGLLDQRPDR